MIRIWLTILAIIVLLGCEKIVIIELPPSQNVIVVEGWLTDVDQIQSIRVIRSNGFLEESPIQTVDSAMVRVERRNGGFQLYSYESDGYYHSTDSFSGNRDAEYRTVITLPNGDVIHSQWDQMPNKTDIEFINLRSYLENDPENVGEQITLYFPKLIARDSGNFDNFYRWVFFKNRVRYTEPESITLQQDRFFDGNLIPNTFEEFTYIKEEEAIVQLQSISNRTYDYLTLLKSQIATLGSSSISTPAVVNGNLDNVTNPDDQVLGYFGTVAISSDTIIAQ